MIKLSLLVIAVILSGFSSFAQSEKVKPNCRWDFEHPIGGYAIYKYENGGRHPVASGLSDIHQIMSAIEKLVGEGVCNPESIFFDKSK